MMSLWNSYKRLGDSFVRVSFDKYAIQINAHRKKKKQCKFVNSKHLSINGI